MNTAEKKKALQWLLELKHQSEEEVTALKKSSKPFTDSIERAEKFVRAFQHIERRLLNDLDEV